MHKAVKAERGGGRANAVVLKGGNTAVKLGKGRVKSKVGGILAHKTNKNVGGSDKLGKMGKSFNTVFAVSG